MFRLKKKMFTVPFFLLLLGLACFLMPVREVRAQSMKITKMKPIGSKSGKIKVKITWRKQTGATSYRVYRSKAYKKQPDIWESEYPKFHKIKTLGKKARSFTDKKRAYGRWYVYKIAAFKKVNGKNRFINESMMYVCTKPDPVGWKKDPYGKGYVSPTRINLDMKIEHAGYGAEGVEIYRKKAGASNSSYKRIAVKKRPKGKWSIQYKDTKVTPGQYYVYRFRTYKKIGRKKRYGSYGPAMTVGAVHKTGKFTVRYLNPRFGSSAEEFLLEITADKYNGKVVFNDDIIATDSSGQEYHFDQYYSYDGQQTWTDFSDPNKPHFTLKGGQSGIIKLTNPSIWYYDDNNRRQYKSASYPVPAKECVFSSWTAITYNGIPGFYEMKLYPDKQGTATVTIDQDSAQ